MRNIKSKLVLGMLLVFLSASCSSPKYGSSNKKTAKHANKMNSKSGHKKTCRKR